MKYDLHSHSYFSDGDLSPTELVDLALKSDISCLALTDHDTLDGLPEVQQAASQVSGFSVINGIELSCSWENQLLHVVGLNIDPSNATLLAGVEANKGRRLTRAEAMFEDLETHNINIREEVAALIPDRGVPTRPHFAEALVQQGLAKDKKQAFKRYLVKGKPGYIPMQWPNIEEIGSWIQAANGVAVLAHPNRYNYTRTKLSRLIVQMRSAGIFGIEVSTSSTDKQQQSMLGELAQKYDLLASIGSDFHSLSQPWARLGGANALAKTLTPVWEKF